MQLIITEKNDAAKQIAQLLGGKAKADKVYTTPVYRFSWQGEDCVTIGLRGHILEVDFAPLMEYKPRRGWYGIGAEGEMIPAQVPDTLPKPPLGRRSPFTGDGVKLTSWNVKSLPYAVYAPLEKLPKEKDIIRSVKNLAKKADVVIIATDYDREGELIGMDALNQVLEVAPEIQAFRAQYSAFTKPEISHAFTHLVDIDRDLADAGKSRQWIDLIWGAVLTRYLTISRRSGFGNVRPSGRVQTPTLALVCAKEKERLAFVPEDYWVLTADCDSAVADASALGGTEGNSGSATGGANDPTSATAFLATHKAGRFKEGAAAEAAYAAVREASFATVSTVDQKSRQVRPPTPFSTTSLQAAAAGVGLSPARTMRIAESLYMSGLISYPRVDNTVYPKSLDLRATAKALSKNPAYAPYVAKLLAQPSLTATRGKTETTDHPPIYPTAAAGPEKLKADEWKLYNLIARRFLATLSGPATMQDTKVALDIVGEPFTAKGVVLAKAGFREIYPYGLKKDEALPALTEGQRVAVTGTKLAKKQTEPPARYSQGRLVQEMEKLGLGTKSTRASIIERLIQVKYVQGDPVEPTQLGMAVIEALEQFAPEITTPQMTANLEGEMTGIAEGKRPFDDVVWDSRVLLDKVLGELIPRIEDVGETLADAVNADARVGTCPKCGRDLQLKYSPKSKSNFVGCAGWPECDVTYAVPQGKIGPVEEVCPTCGKPQIKLIQFRQKPLVRCVDPDCPSNQEPTVNVGECPTCKAAGRHGDLIAQRSPRTLKRFIRCSNYDECKTSYPLPQNGKLEATGRYCPDCGAPLVVIATRRGPWELCPNFDCPGRERKEQEKAAASKKKAKTKKVVKAKKSSIKAK
ncbi:MAG: topoisomerase DNA-binding C4 zinc finger domain-containing protein [Coriobacteriales bacterium]|jgi:DNA topoisomerase-1|nr:topoisomerase DNA-binding C4 zinc finger domain-containing protein [Coriobacteriales bacterium]